MENDTASETGFIELANRWHALSAQLIKAKRLAARRDTEYRATTDGLAESQRRIDLCDDPDNAQRLLAEHRAGERAAAAEYRQRSARWPETPGDGYLFALPLGHSIDELTRTLIALPLLGTVRVPPDESVPVTVGLLHIDTGGARHRTKFTAPRPASSATLTLGEVVVTAHINTANATKIAALLGDAYPLLARHL